MPVIVIARSGRDVLIGQNGIYLQDTHWIDPAVLRDSQRVTQLPDGAGGNRVVANTPADKVAAAQLFRSKAENYTNDLKAAGRIKNFDKIKYDSVKWKVATPADAARGIPALPDRFVTRFIYPIRPAGFIKGTFPDAEFPGETPQQAAAREFREETGTDIPIANFVAVPGAGNIFILTVPLAQKPTITASWRAMDQNYEGELFELTWEPIVDIYKIRDSLNAESRAAAVHLPAESGGATIRRKKSGRSKRKGTSKRGVRRSR